MTVSVDERRVDYTASGSTPGPFAVDFPFFEITVYLDGAVVSPTDYVIDQDEAGGTGDVTFAVNPSAGAKIVILGDTEIEQQVDFISTDAVEPETTERALDRLTMISQELADIASQCVRLPRFSTPIDALDFAANPNSALISDASGAPSFDPTVYQSIEDAINAADAAEASAVAAAASAAAAAEFVAGTKLVFVQASAPAGWTQVTSLDNGTLRIVSGTGGGTGGTANFTDVFAARTIAKENLPASALSVTGSATGGAHTHPYNDARPSGTTGTTGSGQIAQSNSDQARTTGSDGGHTHTVTGTTENMGSGTAMDFAVKYADAIICQKA